MKPELIAAVADALQREVLRQAEASGTDMAAVRLILEHSIDLNELARTALEARKRWHRATAS